ncbi:uncharacterized protein LOC119188741 isoform X2 [Manduca sexta]|uniref:uncharacterized protein LOC119188741 isoform X2 n=1 Tax=Manduca sexta TaxID=7130 RepID=UPI0018902D0E|nr:uncharacterized protein LOC119188741 isoform X2 [Manduca sexta]
MKIMHLCYTQYSKDNKVDKSIDFLHKIKEDLRRNNDDYAEAMTRTITTTTHTVQSNQKFSYKKGNSNIIEDLNRRAYESFSDEENARESKEINFFTTATVKRFSKITQTKPAEPKVANNMNKLQMFFEENKDLLKEFIGNKAMAATNMISRPEPNFRMKAQETVKEVVLPNSEQLDMAPAKGGRIHMLRIKGRLCQRNVLIPEGPKYDSKGKIYLPAFSAGRKQFENTIAPKLILPRCCNCCKKSVLGCE